jgi:hypothetical protein
MKTLCAALCLVLLAAPSAADAGHHRSGGRQRHSTPTCTRHKPRCSTRGNGQVKGRRGSKADFRRVISGETETPAKVNSRHDLFAPEDTGPPPPPAASETFPDDETLPLPPRDSNLRFLHVNEIRR